MKRLPEGADGCSAGESAGAAQRIWHIWGNAGIIAIDPRRAGVWAVREEAARGAGKRAQRGHWVRYSGIMNAKGTKGPNKPK